MVSTKVVEPRAAGVSPIPRHGTAWHGHGMTWGPIDRVVIIALVPPLRVPSRGGDRSLDSPPCAGRVIPQAKNARFSLSFLLSPMSTAVAHDNRLVRSGKQSLSLCVCVCVFDAQPLSRLSHAPPPPPLFSTLRFSISRWLRCSRMRDAMRCDAASPAGLAVNGPFRTKERCYAAPYCTTQRVEPYARNARSLRPWCLASCALPIWSSPRVPSVSAFPRVHSRPHFP